MSIFEKARYITVEGPIGAGKTSLAQKLAQYLHYEVSLENSQQNPFLQRFYDNPQRWALATQLSFLFERTEQLDQLRPDKRKVINDFLLEKEQLFAQINLSDDELPLYQTIFKRLHSIPSVKPDLIIYLQAPTGRLMERIQRRGLRSEHNLQESYVRKVAERYADFFYHYDAAPVFTIDTARLNPIDHDDDFLLLIKRLSHMRSYREFFGYDE